MPAPALLDLSITASNAGDALQGLLAWKQAHKHRRVKRVKIRQVWAKLSLAWI